MDTTEDLCNVNYDRTSDQMDPASSVRAACELLVRQAILAKASACTRVGRYGEAEAILADATQDASAHPALLDMLARTLAQQGLLERAETLWEAARERDPKNRDYAAALRRCAAIRAHPVRETWRVPTFIGTVTAFCVLVVVVVWQAGARHTGGLLAASQVDVPPPPLHDQATTSQPDADASLAKYTLFKQEVFAQLQSLRQQETDARLAEYALFKQEVFALLQGLQQRETDARLAEYALFEREAFTQLLGLQQQDLAHLTNTILQAERELQNVMKARQEPGTMQPSLLGAFRRRALRKKTARLDARLEELRRSYEERSRPYDEAVDRLREHVPRKAGT